MWLPRRVVAMLTLSTLVCSLENWAVVVDTSVLWNNYRHHANAMAVYNELRSNGIPDERIILMTADDIACGAENPFSPHVVFSNGNQVYPDDVELDYRGQDVTVDNFRRVLLGKHSPFTHASRRLNVNRESNLLIYLTGHGGDEFMKFLDWEQLTSHDFGRLFDAMFEQSRYNEILFIADTCEASTLGRHIKAPRITFIGSSGQHENSYSYKYNTDVDQPVADRFTHRLIQVLQKWPLQKTSIRQLVFRRQR